MATDTSQAKRLNILIGEGLLKWTTAAAKRRGMSVSAVVRHALERERERSREQDIEVAAEELAPLYESEAKLQDFRALDGEEFA